MADTPATRIRHRRPGQTQVSLYLPDALVTWLTEEAARQKARGLTSNRNTFLRRLIAEAKQRTEEDHRARHGHLSATETPVDVLVERGHLSASGRTVVIADPARPVNPTKG